MSPYFPIYFPNKIQFTTLKLQYLSNTDLYMALLYEGYTVFFNYIRRLSREIDLLELV